LTASARAQADGIGAQVEKRLTRPGKLPEYFVVLKLPEYFVVLCCVPLLRLSLSDYITCTALCAGQVLKHAYLHYYHNQDLYVSNDKEVDVFWLKFCRLKEIHEVGGKRWPAALSASSLCRALLSTSCPLLFFIPPSRFCCPCPSPSLRNATE
jgi:hypothetical protein